jgi:hypothetical protein
VNPQGADPIVRLEHGRRPVEQRAVILRKGRERGRPITKSLQGQESSRFAMNWSYEQNYPR